MRITHTVWIRGKDPFDIALISTRNKAGRTQYIITEHQTGEERRVLSQAEARHLEALLDGLSLPVIPQPTKHGGKTYMLQLETGFNSVAYYWNSKSPGGWEKLKELSDLLVNAYTECSLPEHKIIEVKSKMETVPKGREI